MRLKWQIVEDGITYGTLWAQHGIWENKIIICRDWYRIHSHTILDILFFAPRLFLIWSVHLRKNHSVKDDDKVLFIFIAIAAICEYSSNVAKDVRVSKKLYLKKNNCSCPICSFNLNSQWCFVPLLLPDAPPPPPFFLPSNTISIHLNIHPPFPYHKQHHILVITVSANQGRPSVSPSTQRTRTLVKSCR